MDERQQLILSEKTSSLLVKFSIPAIVGMLVNALYNLADSIFVSKGAGTMEYNGVLATVPVVAIIFAVGVGVSQGAAAMVSIELGRNNQEKVEKVIGNLYILVLIASVIFLIAGLFFAEPIAYFFGARGESLTPGAAYAGIMMSGAFFIVLGPSVGVLLRAIGEFREAMIVMIIGVLVNVILDPIFIYDWGLGLGAAGAAWASVIGFAVSVMYIFARIFRKYPILRPHLRNIKFDSSICGNILLIGLPGIIRNVTISIATLIFNRVLLGYDPIYFSIFGTYSRISMVIIMPSFGIVQGMMPIIGVNYGAKKYERVREVSKAALAMVHIYLFVFGAVLSTLFAKQILGLFVGENTLDSEIFISEGVKAFRILFPMIIFSGSVTVQSAVTQSLGQRVEPTLISLLRVVLVIPVLYILVSVLDFGVMGIWWAYPIADIISTIISLTCFVYTMRRLKRLDV